MTQIVLWTITTPVKKLIIFIWIYLLLPIAICQAQEKKDDDVTVEVERQAEGEPVINVEKTGIIDGRRTRLLLQDIPETYEREGIQLQHRYHLNFYGSDVNHRLPSMYLESLPPAEGREGLPEHLMLAFYSNFRSLYMSREYPCSKGPVWQPSATIEAYNVGFNVWSNFVLNDEANQGQFNEVDLTLYYTVHIGNLTIHPYLLSFLMPNGDPASLNYSPNPATVETDIYLGYKVWQFIFESLTRVGVYSNAGQVYSNIGVSFTQPFDHGLSLNVHTHLSFGNDRFLTSHIGIGQDIDTNIDAIAGLLALSWNAWKGLSLTPNVQAAVHVPPSIRRAIRQNPDQSTYYIWGGLDVAYNF